MEQPETIEFLKNSVHDYGLKKLTLISPVYHYYSSNYIRLTCSPSVRCSISDDFWFARFSARQWLNRGDIIGLSLELEGVLAFFVHRLIENGIVHLMYGILVKCFWFLSHKCSRRVARKEHMIITWIKTAWKRESCNSCLNTKVFGGDLYPFDCSAGRLSLMVEV